MTDAVTMSSAAGRNAFPRARLVLADGTVFEGHGFGAPGQAVGEVCFNTAMTGYQEILSDPSYAGQIVCFTFPHIGIVGANNEDIEYTTPHVRGLIVRADAASPSNYRALMSLDAWLKKHNIPAIAGIDTRALTSRIRSLGMPHGVIGRSDDVGALQAAAQGFPGLVGLDLAKEVTARQMYTWDETPWEWNKGYGKQETPTFRAVVLDYGVKKNILRLLAGLGADIIVLPAQSSLEDVLRHEPHGVVLSNGPGDPAATGEYAIPVIRGVIDKGLPVFGICLGHQMLGIALGGTTKIGRAHV